MKRSYILVVLLGLVLAAVVNGCDKGAPPPAADTATNAAPAAPAPPPATK